MRMITAIIRPGKYADVRTALVALDVKGITLTQVQGFGRQRGQTEIYRGAEYEVMEVPKLQISVASSDDQESAIVEAIAKAANTGKVGDGKIFVTELKKVVRIRTSEADQAALD